MENSCIKKLKSLFLELFRKKEEKKEKEDPDDPYCSIIEEYKPVSKKSLL